MDEHHRRPIVERGEQRVLPVFAEVRSGVVGQQHDTVGLQLVERPDRFSDGLVDVRHWHCGEKPEPVRLCGCQRGGVVVDVTREGGRVDRVGQKCRAGGRHRQDGGTDGEFSHRLQREINAPVRERPSAGFVQSGSLQGFSVVGRNHVVMGVDACHWFS